MRQGCSADPIDGTDRGASDSASAAHGLAVRARGQRAASYSRRTTAFKGNFQSHWMREETEL